MGPHQSMSENKASCRLSILFHRHLRFGLRPCHWLPTWPLSLKRVEDLNVPLDLNSLHHLNLIDIVSWFRDSPHCWLAVPMTRFNFIPPFLKRAKLYPQPPRFLTSHQGRLLKHLENTPQAARLLSMVLQLAWPYFPFRLLAVRPHPAVFHVMYRVRG